MEERKCFGCGGFGHITCNCRNAKEEELILMLSNKFEVLKSRLMQRGEDSGRETSKDRKTILREERAKREESVEVQKTGVEKSSKGRKKKGKLLREVMVKIGLK